MSERSSSPFLWFGALGLIGFLVARRFKIKRKSLEHFRYSVLSVKPAKKGRGANWFEIFVNTLLVNLTSLELLVKVRLVNPNQESIPLLGFNGKVLHEGKEIGYFNNTSHVNIDGNFTTDLDLLVTINNLSFLSSLRQVILSKAKVQTLTIDGFIKTATFTQPFTTTTSINIPSLDFLKKNKNKVQPKETPSYEEVPKVSPSTSTTDTNVV